LSLLEYLVYTEFYPYYQKLMREDNYIDFGDLLLSIIEISKNSERFDLIKQRFHYFLIDEARDLN